MWFPGVTLPYGQRSVDPAHMLSLVSDHFAGYRIANADAAHLGDYRNASYSQRAEATLQRSLRYQPYTTPKQEPFSRSADVPEVEIGRMDSRIG